MAPIDESEGLELEPEEVWDGVLRVLREVELRQSGVLVTHHLASTGPQAAKFQLIDPLPASLTVEEVGFHPEYEPHYGRIDGNRAVISGVVASSEELVVKYGLRTPRTGGPSELDDLRAAPEPVIELSEAVDPDAVEADDLEASVMTRSSATEDQDKPDPSAFFDRIQRRLAAGSESTTEKEATRAEPSSDAEDHDSGGPAVDDRGSRSSLSGDPFGASPENGSLAAALTPGTEMAGSASESQEGVDGSEAGSGSPERGVEEDPVEALLHNLEASELSDDDRRRLADRLLRLLASSEEPKRSTEVRLQHLESKLQEFEAYSQAFESIIDTHGPAKEFLSGIRDEIQTQNTETDELHTAIEQATATRKGVIERLDALADEVAAMDSRQKQMENRLDALLQSHRRSANEVEGRLSQLEPAVQELETLDSDIEGVRKEVRDLQDRLDAMGSALVGSGVERE